MDYKQLSKILEKNINDNLYNNIGKLPTEDEIIEDYDSTRYSVRKAINTLIDKGLVYSVQGSGVFIRKNIKNDYINISFNYGYTGLKNKYPDKKVEYKLINLAIIESQEEIANKMLCEVGKKLYYIIRLTIIIVLYLQSTSTAFNAFSLSVASLFNASINVSSFLA